MLLTYFIFVESTSLNNIKKLVLQKGIFRIQYIKIL